MMRPIVIAPAFVFAIASAGWTQAPPNAPMSEACGLLFAVPQGWEVARIKQTRETSETRATCHFAVQPRDLQARLAANDSIDVYSIFVHVGAVGFRRALPESGFERRGGKWVVLGRQGFESPADTVSGAGWAGVRGIATVGCSGRDGRYAGLCDQPTALVGTSGRNAELLGGAQSEETFNRILATLRFR